MATERSGSVSRLLGFVAMFIAISSLHGSSSAASGHSICTFTSSSMVFDERQGSQTLTFSWDNETGAIQHNGPECSSEAAAAGGTAYYDAQQGGNPRVHCGLNAVPGNVTPGFSPTGKLTSSIYLLLRNGSEIRGTLHAGGGHSSRPILFSGAWYAEHNYLLTGYGSVSCSN